MRTRGDRRDQAHDTLSARAGGGAVVANGTQLAVQLPAAQRVEALADLQRAEIPIEDFWVVGPSLEEIVQRFFGGREG